ncbi:MAG TPA: saccharopine dehydrogenase C-terminal domain-containing protein [Vicinamibacterales bacterium]|nr:saccharopine dehydrogenase C-terminal domain-containing protein [Vicinamibacterales bacterium]
MPHILVLGAGLVGRAIVHDLSRDCEVTAVDRSGAALAALPSQGAIRTIAADVLQPGILADLAERADLIVTAVPGHIGYRTLEAAIRTRRNIVDISFFPEDALALDGLAREHGVTAIVDCGVAPGMSHMIAGAAARDMTLDTYECLVGGLPKARTSFAQYKAPFSPRDVIEEYTRPARYVSGGQVVTVQALTDVEPVAFARVGTLEAFNTDGLRTLLKTLPIAEMKEKTLRYPGHAAIMQRLRDEGAFAPDRIEETSATLFREWALQPGEEEFTVMRVTMTGHADGARRTVVYDLYDETDRATGLSSMARTTGFTATAAAHLLLDGRVARPGIWPPEYVGREEGCLASVLDALRARGVEYRRTDA